MDCPLFGLVTMTFGGVSGIFYICTITPTTRQGIPPSFTSFAKFCLVTQRPLMTVYFWGWICVFEVWPGNNRVRLNFIWSVTDNRSPKAFVISLNMNDAPWYPYYMLSRRCLGIVRTSAVENYTLICTLFLPTTSPSHNHFLAHPCGGYLDTVFTALLTLTTLDPTLLYPYLAP